MNSSPRSTDRRHPAWYALTIGCALGAGFWAGVVVTLAHLLG